jgi:hypothetical protein
VQYLLHHSDWSDIRVIWPMAHHIGENFNKFDIQKKKETYLCYKVFRIERLTSAIEYIDYFCVHVFHRKRIITGGWSNELK